MSKPSISHVLAHISERPWSDYSASDYTPEQWHAACLIHLHDKAIFSKAQCKLPVKTPNGALNRNGVHAAAAALAGARGGVIAPQAQKDSAAAILRSCYKTLEEDPPSSLMMHSGVKGMHWGVRKEDDAAKQARFEEKAQKYIKRSKELQKTIDAIDAKPKNFFNRRHLATVKKELETQKKIELDNAEKKRQGKLTDHQRHVAIGVGVGVALLAAYGTYQTVQSGEVHRLSMNGKAALFGKESIAWAKKPELATKELTHDALLHSVVKPINPGFGAPGTTMNCRRATFAYEMRRRGYDVAATRTANGRGQHSGGLITALDPNRKKNYIGGGRVSVMAELGKEQAKKAFGPTATPLSDSLSKKQLFGHSIIDGDYSNMHEKIFNTLSTQPDRARGEIGVGFLGGGGHSMAWEIVHGKPIIFDNQSGKSYQTASSLLGDFKLNIDKSGYTRLDNVPLNQEFLKRWLTNAS